MYGAPKAPMARAYNPNPDSIPCEKCGTGMEGCFAAANGMKLRAWLCPSCHWFCKAIGRERSIVREFTDGIQ